jgi:FAD/FMN-containing dehydrogenase
MPPTHTIGPDDTGLRAAVQGEVVASGDEDWDSARRAWNLAVDQRPELVVFPAGPGDVVAAVEYAQASELALAVQGTGHGAGARGSLEGAVLLNMARFDGFEIDPERRVVRVAGGQLWGPVVEAAAEYGLAPLSGSARDVGAAGYVLGGGFGWLGRRYGLACNSVKALEVVTADGRRRRADATEEPELFWALRGGGGSFAVVTAIELELFPVERLYTGWLLWPVERAAEVFELYNGWADTVPDELTSVVRILNLPPLEAIPEPLRGKSWAVVEGAFLGDEAGGSRLLEPLRAAGPVMDTFATTPIAALGELHADPPEPVPGLGHGVLLDDLSAEAIGALVRVAGAGSGSPLLSVELRHVGGALARPQPGHGALGAIDGKFALYAVGMVPGPEHAERVVAGVDAVLDALAPCSRGRTYLNFKDRPGDASSAFDRDTYQRLTDVKTAYDPGDLIRANHPVEPRG